MGKKLPNFHCEQERTYADLRPRYGCEGLFTSFLFISPNLQGRKADLVDIATNFGTDSTSTMAAIKLRKFDGDDIVFWDRQQQPSFEAVTFVDSDLLYATNKLDRQVAGLTVDKDGYDVRCNGEDTS